MTIDGSWGGHRTGHLFQRTAPDLHRLFASILGDAGNGAAGGAPRMTDLTGIELDRLLCDPEQVRALTDPRPTPENDQRDAAADHAQRIQSYVAALGGMSREYGIYRDYPDWMRLGVAQTVATWVSGKGRTCFHAPTPLRPQPVFAAAWKPDLVVCQPCCHLLRFPHGSVKDRTCDRCGHVVSGNPPDLITSNSLRLGSVTWMYGLCASCGASPTSESGG